QAIVPSGCVMMMVSRACSATSAS
ncbi:putative periplasmic binding -like domain protein, partial [Vibrio parahaemolyticus V-223/04]